METARLIAGENPPRWLVRHLQHWSPSVFLDGNVHAKQLGRAEARARLQKLSEATESVDRELNEDIIANCLIADEFGPLPDNVGLDRILGEIRRRAEVAASRRDLLGTGLDLRLENLSDGLKLIARELQDPELSEFLKAEQIVGPPKPTEKLGDLLKEIKRQADAAVLSAYLANEVGQTRAGSGRALLPTAGSPRAFCAAIILEAWAHFHDGDYPRASNHPQLWAAAEEYWRACGGVTKGGWNNGRPSAWRPYFVEASEYSLASMRDELRRHMIESSTHNY